jgi:UDP-2,4-diacetamido-2,4,6-trideoxy-beta-L-altropyranose hydrolase
MIIIRSDSSFEIGTGHIMRCLVLADLLTEMGLKTHFVCRDLPGNISSKIQEQGFSLTLLPPTASENEEVKQINEMNPDWVVVDHYGLDAAWEKNFSGTCKIFVIDDLANRPHQSNVLLDQNYHKNLHLYQDLVPGDCRLYVGCEFALLRKSVMAAAQIKKKNNSILCFFGGTDFTGEGLKLAKVLTGLKSEYHFNLVIGKNNVHFKELTSLQSPNFTVLVEPHDWESLLAESFLYFGSGGTVTWERFFLGVPGVVVSVAENQEKIAEELAVDGLQLYWGKASDLSYNDVVLRLMKVAADKDLLKQIAERGAKKVRPVPVEILKMWFAGPTKGFSLKPATMEHLQFLFELRNDESTRKMFRNQDPVKLEDHKQWLEKKLKDRSSRLYVGYSDSLPCGQFRVDADHQTSVSIDPAFRGKGLGEKLISEGTKMFFLENPNVQFLKADIKNENIGSVKSFKAAGYRELNDSGAEPGYFRLTCENKG